MNLQVQKESVTRNIVHGVKLEMTCSECGTKLYLTSITPERIKECRCGIRYIVVVDISKL